MTDSVNPSILAWVALLGWPIVAFVLVKKYEVQRAVILAILIPYLFLPLRVKLDVPGLPGITKAIIPGIAIVFALMAAKHRFLELPKPLFLRVVLLLLFAPDLLDWLGMSRYYLPLFYVDLVGVSVQVVFMALLNVFFYLDKRVVVLQLCALFVVLNATLTLLSQYLGPSFFGYGFTVSLVCCVFVALVQLNHALDDLKYDTFMLNR